MTTNLKSWIAAYAILSAASQSTWAQESPHWNKTTCNACHVTAAPVAGSFELKEPNAELLCQSCHGDRGGALPCRHVSDVPAGGLSIDETLLGSLMEDKVVCSTCHDIVFQCERPKNYYSFENPAFLRGRDYQKTSDYCFRCHEPSAYEKLKPHSGVTGDPPVQSCTICHESIPSSTTGAEVRVSFNMGHDLNEVCRGCHNSRPHPKNMFAANSSNEWIHLVVPPDTIVDNLRKFEAETGMELPLDPQNGEIFCATCHNPHDFKVGGQHGSETPGSKHRLRHQDICQACHDK